MNGYIYRGLQTLSLVALFGLLACDDDENEGDGSGNRPPVFRTADYAFEVSLDAAEGTVVGTVEATDSDDGDDDILTFRITEPDDPAFEIDESSGEISVMAGAELGAVGDTHSLMVEVSDNNTEAEMTDEVPVVITVIAASVDYLNGNTLIDISNLEQLDAIRHDLDSDGVVDNTGDVAAYVAAFPGAMFDVTPTGYELTRSLDFEDASSYASDAVDKGWSETEGGVGWLPIGSFAPGGNSTPFENIFEGGGFTISNLYINRPDGEDVGLFGYTFDVTIRGLGIIDANITAFNFVGALIGTADRTRQDASMIEACYSTGSVVVLEPTAIGGGLIGFNSARMSACYSTCSVTDMGSGGTIGGLVGVNRDVLVANYATGDITATSGPATIGGLVGVNLGAVAACYATGDVTGSGETVAAGGLVGANGGVNSNGTAVTGFAHGNYSNGGVSAIGAALDRVGGLVGVNTSSSTIQESYFNTDMTSQRDTQQGKTTVELQAPTVYDNNDESTDDSSLYENWNVDVDNADGDNDLASNRDDPWNFGTASEYPVLEMDFNSDGSTVDDVVTQRSTAFATSAK